MCVCVRCVSLSVCAWGAVTLGRAIFGTWICGEKGKIEKESVID